MYFVSLQTLRAMTNKSQKKRTIRYNQLMLALLNMTESNDYLSVCAFKWHVDTLLPILH